MLDHAVPAGTLFVTCPSTNKLHRVLPLPSLVTLVLAPSQLSAYDSSLSKDKNEAV